MSMMGNGVQDEVRVDSFNILLKSGIMRTRLTYIFIYIIIHCS